MEKLIRPSGNYRKLLSYQKTEVIYEMTFYFCNTYLQKGDRTVDQMVQAARSGKQNIIEGSAASSTSAKTEIKLVNVAKASLQELLEDYIDYLRTRGHRQWEEGSVELETIFLSRRDFLSIALHPAHNPSQTSKPPRLTAPLHII